MCYSDSTSLISCRDTIPFITFMCIIGSDFTLKRFIFLCSYTIDFYSYKIRLEFCILYFVNYYIRNPFCNVLYGFSLMLIVVDLHLNPCQSFLSFLVRLASLGEKLSSNFDLVLILVSFGYGNHENFRLFSYPYG